MRQEIQMLPSPMNFTYTYYVLTSGEKQFIKNFILLSQKEKAEIIREL